MEKLLLTFERGGRLIADFNDSAPETVRQIKAILPCQSQLVHSRYCGREICFGIETKAHPAEENLQICADKFDVAYWRNWENPERVGLPGSPGAETINLYYGREKILFKGQPLNVSIIGRISPDQEAMLDEIGNRIWQQGFEKVYAELIDRE